MEGDSSSEALTSLDNAQTAFQLAGGYNVQQRISTVLKGLGFTDEQQELTCDTFSGGWQMRIALAKLLLSEPNLLVLDEPTNHLDDNAKNWLGEYLSNYKGTVIIVSHDVSLLKRAVRSIAEIQHNKVELYKSRSYDQWKLERVEREKAVVSEYESGIEDIAKLQVSNDIYIYIIYIFLTYFGEVNK